jgi:uncharacterized membrane protein
MCLKDKEHVTQLLRSEAHKDLGAIAEISQYKFQVVSLTHMLEALTQSKQLVSEELQMQQAMNNEVQFSSSFSLFVDRLCLVLLNEVFFFF